MITKFLFQFIPGADRIRGYEENQEKAVPVKDNENKRTHKELLEIASRS